MSIALDRQEQAALAIVEESVEGVYFSFAFRTVRTSAELQVRS